MLSRSAAQAYPGGHPLISREKRGGPHERDGANVGTRLDAVLTALSEAQHLAGSCDLDARFQAEFRGALDHLRDTASAVQRWFEAQAKCRDPYAVLLTLAIQRVHRATQLAKDLSLDLDNMDVTMETEGLQDLYQAISELHHQLGVLCKPGK
jgi:hypothetical protein